MRRSDGGGPIRLPPSESPIWRSGRAWRPGGAASTTTTGGLSLGPAHADFPSPAHRRISSKGGGGFRGPRPCSLCRMGRPTVPPGGSLMSPISRGFRGRRLAADPARIPPGQYVTGDFPVLSAGPTPHTPLDQWDFSIIGEVDEPRGWTWEAFRALPSEEITRDIHCVTKWSKLDTVWQGVSVDTLLDGIETSAQFVTQYSDGGYTTNLPLEDVTDGKAWVAFAYDGEPLEPEHGGPARMLVPHLYFWKSAKWARGLRLQSTDEPGFWETNGYHNYGDPWREQRYWGD